MSKKGKKGKKVFVTLTFDDLDQDVRVSVFSSRKKAEAYAGRDLHGVGCMHLAEVGVGSCTDITEVELDRQGIH